MGRNKARSDAIKIKSKFARIFHSTYEDNFDLPNYDAGDGHNKRIYESPTSGAIKKRLYDWVPQFDYGHDNLVSLLQICT